MNGGIDLKTSFGDNVKVNADYLLNLFSDGAPVGGLPNQIETDRVFIETMLGYQIAPKNMDMGIALVRGMIIAQSFRFKKYPLISSP
jgi:hypothetical protein